MAKDVVSRAMSRSVVDMPFFAVLLMRRPMHYTEAVPTAAVDQAANIFVNPGFFAGLSPAEAQFVLLHEAYHVFFQHAQRKGVRDHQKWNMACDAVINGSMKKLKACGQMPAQGFSLPGVDDAMSAEQVYAQLPDNPDRGRKGAQDNDPGDDLLEGNHAPDGQGHGPGQPKPLTAAEKGQLDADLKADISQAAASAKARGRLPGNIEAMVNEILSVKTPWFEILERLLTSYTKGDISWQRPNRRFVAQGTYLPSVANVLTLDRLVLGIDTSGSVSDRELAYFAGHLNRIMELCKPHELAVVNCDACVASVRELTAEDLPVTLRREGGGGTSFQPVFDWVEQDGRTPDVLVYLTDGYGDQDCIQDPGYPVVWLTTGREEGFTFGQVIKFEMET